MKDDEVRFEWDAKKAAQCFAERGIRFEDAAAAFDNAWFEKQDDRKDYGEVRFHRICETASGELLFVTYTERIPKIRIISVRPLNKKERNLLK